jgi:predicted heme/steroid binding protein
MRVRLAAALLLVGVLGIATPAQATEEYAQQTGKACSACHQDPAGGGELTGVGQAFLAARTPGPAPESRTVGWRLLRLVAGYVHLLTAILWFGTILYVHLVLKPAYAVHGLPPGEVRLGRISMLVMAVSGLALARFRIHSFDTLLHTRFGVLLLVKAGLFLGMVASAMVAVHLLGPRLRRHDMRPVGAAGSEPDGGDLSPEELARFDGQEGRPAYVGYAGRIYDVTGSGMWTDGVHFARHHAGQDLTESLSLAPHNAQRILARPLVGKLDVTRAARTPSLPERIFYVLAYLNLVLAAGIILIVALWRWG